MILLLVVEAPQVNLKIFSAGSHKSSRVINKLCLRRSDFLAHLEVGLRDAEVAVSPPVVGELRGVGARAVGEGAQVARRAAAAGLAPRRRGLEDVGGE